MSGSGNHLYWITVHPLKAEDDRSCSLQLLQHGIRNLSRFHNCLSGTDREWIPHGPLQSTHSFEAKRKHPKKELPQHPLTSSLIGTPTITTDTDKLLHSTPEPPTC